MAASADPDLVSVSDLVDLARRIEEAHADILARVDTAKSRVVTVESLYAELSELTGEQEAFLRAAIDCIRHGLHRAAIVMAWAALIDRAEEIHAADGYQRLGTARPKWKLTTREALSETYTEHAIVEASETAGVLSKTQRKSLHGLLHRRNQAAHPGPFKASLNISLAYVEDVVNEIRALATQ